MNTWRAIGYIFSGIGIIFLIYTLYLTLTFKEVTTYVSYLDQYVPGLSQAVQGYNQTLLLGVIAPWVIIAAISFVIGGVGLFAGRNNSTNRKPLNQNIQSEVLLERLGRLETIVDNNFEIVTKRVDKLEEQQKLASQNTLIRAKKDSS
jgi:hypothetical protein